MQHYGARSHGSHRGNSNPIASACGGVLFGLLLIFSSVPLLWWNEGNAVSWYTSLNEALSEVKSLEEPVREGRYEGSLVHVVGTTFGATLQDEEFGVASENALAIRRVVEMYSWVEDRDTRTERDSQGNERQHTTYRYSKKWSSTVQDSSHFNENYRGEYNNPASLPFRERTFSSSVRVGPRGSAKGGFELSERLRSQLLHWEELYVSATGTSSSSGSNAVVAASSPKGFRAVDGALYHSASGGKISANSPRVGDTRVTFQKVTGGRTVSLIAQQSGKYLTPYRTSTGKEIALTAGRADSATNMIAMEVSATASTTWICRALGFGMMFFGLLLTTTPINMIVSFLNYIPLVGPLATSIVSFATSMFAFVTAVFCSVIVIAASWFAHRPMLAVSLVAGAVGLFFALGQFTQRHSTRKDY
ncbi:hypothetical protein CYMTET_16599 [Cymbomonas tetramitiformis]|uniref:Uncharacterized protein n=1 Tax=Cymbomonas tetramitiformis TaxID=36881 RepID=A0AAE0GC90_9CHLO|nr:hypothetical protein CYMTET_16599 [Cymbomonas tetramitiformis]